MGILICLMILTISHSSRYFPEQGEAVNYWLIWLQYLDPFAVVVILGGLSAILAIVSLLNTKSHIFEIFTWFFLINICSSVFCFGSVLTTYTTFRHLASVNAHDQKYNLAHYSFIMNGGDFYGAYYLVYRCDTMGFRCSLISEFNDIGYHFGSPTQAHLGVDKEKGTLYLEVDNEKHLIEGTSNFVVIPTTHV